MFFKKNNGFGYNPTILIAPLDWGLGHATRCIPIIRHLLNNGATVVVAANGQIKALLQQEFNQLEFLNLPGYKMRYSTSNRQVFALLRQIPKLIKAVYGEHKWLKKILQHRQFDAVIADNRLGFYNRRVKCIYITHQLTIKTGSRLTDWIAQKIHYRFINKYSECWVPDNGGVNNFAGALSHPVKKPHIPVTYIGVLSRFEKSIVDKKYHLLVVLSGPEPQRTIFENKILQQLKNFEKNVLLVRGLPGNNETLSNPNKNIEIHSHLDAAALNTAILQSKIILCRSGYTTIMDLIALEVKAILVPTPGQTEQEYLATYIKQKDMFYSTTQAGFSLQNAIAAAADFACKIPPVSTAQFEPVITAFLKKLQP
jgi:uncharacterized protein (TIGR00661 family)